MRVAAVIGDLMLYSRIDAAATAAGASLLRVNDPGELPVDEPFDLILVDWSLREDSWSYALRSRADVGSRVVLFGRHADLEAHAASRAAGLGPMWARSKLVAELPDLLDS